MFGLVALYYLGTRFSTLNHGHQLIIVHYLVLFTVASTSSVRRRVLDLSNRISSKEETPWTGRYSTVRDCTSEQHLAPESERCPSSQPQAVNLPSTACRRMWCRDCAPSRPNSQSRPVLLSRIRSSTKMWMLGHLRRDRIH